MTPSPTRAEIAPDMDMFKAVLARVEHAAGPDRDLDGEIETVLRGGTAIWKQANYTMENYLAIRRTSADHLGGFVNEHCPLLTASIDAAVGLIEQVLPSRQGRFTLDHYRATDGAVICEADLRMGGTEGLAKGPTPALALLAALLRALIAQVQTARAA